MNGFLVVINKYCGGRNGYTYGAQKYIKHCVSPRPRTRPPHTSTAPAPKSGPSPQPRTPTHAYAHDIRIRIGASRQPPL